MAGEESAIRALVVCGVSRTLPHVSWRRVLADNLQRWERRSFGFSAFHILAKLCLDLPPQQGAKPNAEDGAKKSSVPFLFGQFSFGGHQVGKFAPV